MTSITVRFIDGSKFYADALTSDAITKLRKALERGARIHALTNQHTGESTIICLDKIISISIMGDQQ